MLNLEALEDRNSLLLSDFIYLLYIRIFVNLHLRNSIVKQKHTFIQVIKLLKFENVSPSMDLCDIILLFSLGIVEAFFK